jgi:DNA-directed RNA polymerase subunit RPC12/RpoP
MPKEPPHFDCRSAWAVLRLRLKDWMWPAAIAGAIAIPYLGRTAGPYRIGSFTYYFQHFSPFLWLALVMFAGFRWSWIGRMRPRDRGACPRCGYRLDGLDARDPAARCPECGTDAATRRMLAARPSLRRTFDGLTLARALLDLPALLAVLLPVLLVTLLVLMIFGFIED